MAGITIIVASISAVLLAGGGFLAGRSKGRSEVAEVARALEAQNEQMQTVASALTDVQSIASRPVVLDAEIRDSLAKVPAQCRGERGDPLSLACAWATCLQFGQSSSQRPECRSVEAAYIASLSCSEGTP